MLKYQIGITLIPGVGDVNGKKLISYCGSAEAVFKEKKKALLKIPGIGELTVNSIVSQNVLERAEEEVAFIEKYRIKTLFFNDKDYPKRLKHCIDSPIMLYYKGNADLNSDKIISLVGTRRATEYGKEICSKIIEELSHLKVIVVSGLAYGIDAKAHQAALQFGLETVGVLAHGLDRIYPYAHKSMAEKMINSGGYSQTFSVKPVLTVKIFQNGTGSSPVYQMHLLLLNRQSRVERLSLRTLPTHITGTYLRFRER